MLRRSLRFTLHDSAYAPAPTVPSPSPSPLVGRGDQALRLAQPHSAVPSWRSPWISSLRWNDGSGVHPTRANSRRSGETVSVAPVTACTSSGV